MRKEEIKKFLEECNEAFATDGFDSELPLLVSKETLLEEMDTDMFDNEANKKMVAKSSSEYFYVSDFGAKVTAATNEIINQLVK